MNEQEYDPKKIWNLPNALTMFRMVLIPVFVYLFMNGFDMPALGVYCAASLTDIADGHIARKYHMITDFGKLVDPLADKLMVIALMITMLLRGIIPAVILIILCGKELLMVFGGLFMLKKGIVVYSAPIGKAAQATVVIGLILCFFHGFFAEAGVPVHLIVLWCGIFLTIAALFYYGKNAVIKLKEQKSEENKA